MKDLTSVRPLELAVMIGAVILAIALGESVTLFWISRHGQATQADTIIMENLIFPLL